MDSGVVSKREMWRGALAALGAAITFGLSAPFAKLLLGAVSPFLMAGLLYLGSGAILTIYLSLRTRKSRKPLSKAEVPSLAAAVLSGGVIAPILLLYGLSRTSASTASLLLNLEGVFTALFAWIVFGELFNKRIGLGMALITAGGLCVSWSSKPGTEGLSGSILIGAACVFWALDNNFTRRVASCDAIQIAAIKGIVAGGVNTLLALCISSVLPPWSIIAACALLGFVSYGLSLALFVVALRIIGAARTGAYFSTAPFIGAVVAFGLGDPIERGILFAAMLMGLGVWLHLTENPEQVIIRDS